LNFKPGEENFGAADYDRGHQALAQSSPMPPAVEPIVILSTCPDEASASRIARALVESGLAACVSRLGPVQSTYRWQGALQDEPEVLLLIKTLKDRYAELEVRLKSLHPYEVPEIIALPVAAGGADYLTWLQGAVG
jgi:periplasmic divalent cation tolerance protein